MEDTIFLNNKVDISSERATIWRVCNQLRGPYGSTVYANIIIPFTVLRRFDCSIKDTKDKVVAEYQAHKDVSAKKLASIAGRQFYNTSPFSFEKLLDDADGILDNWKLYIDGFSKNIIDICNNIYTDGLISLITAMHKKGVEFSKLGILPLIDCGDNDFISYGTKDGNWFLFNIVDEVRFDEKESLSELL